MEYKRILLKLSGEVLGGAAGTGIDAASVARLCGELKALQDAGMQVAVVLGGGNFWRYRDNAELKIARTTSDAMGMMATIMNARFLAEALRGIGCKANALAAHGEGYFAEPYTPGRARALLEQGHMVICGGGTGNPYFTTDTTAALRALELECEVLLKGTKVDGIYDADPVKNPQAKRFDQITYQEVLDRGLGIMDLTAITLCKENALPVRVFNLHIPGLLAQAAQGVALGSLITV